MSFVSVKEAANLLGVSRQRVQELITTEKLPAVKLTGGKVWMVKETDVIARVRRLVKARSKQRRPSASGPSTPG
jgi:excisionase family DNA binding protein